MIVELDAGEALRFHHAAAGGDAEAIEFWRGLFGGDAGECFLCGRAVEPDSRVAIFAHPTARGRVFATQCCADCWALPPLYRAGRALKMLRSIWPEGKWRLAGGRG